MKPFLAVTALLATVLAPTLAFADQKRAPSFYDLRLTTIDGAVQQASDYKGMVLLIVNTASRCGFTGQYEDLQKLHQKYAARGLAVMGFPSNDFMGQEPGTNKEIAAACSRDYGVGFRMFAKAPVTGDDIQPVFEWLTDKNPSLRGRVMWNFEKFLISRRGQLLNRYRSPTSPSDPKVINAIENALAESTK